MFKSPAMQLVYEACKKAGADLTSDFYDQNGNPRRDGTPLRSTYWKGRDNIPCRSGRQSLAYAAWAAGRDDRKTFGKKS